MIYATLGEIMLRLSTPGNERFVQSTSFDINYGGGEANVALSLCNLGEEARFLSKIPNNDIGQAAINSLRQFGVDTSGIVRGGDRLGIYFLETGASVRPSKVIYDRAHSAICEAKPSEFNFRKLLKGVSWLHITGITPALGKNCQAITLKALQAAKAMGITVSFDLNYRAKLWTKEEAQSVMIPFMEYVDYVIGNEEDAEACLGFSAGGDVSKGKLDAQGYGNMLRAMCEKFHLRGAAASLRESHSASDNGWSGVLYTNGKAYVSAHYDLRIVDRVGGGDSFAAGLIYGLTHYEDSQKAIDCAVAHSALKHTIPGDFNHVGIKEVESLMAGNTNGRVQR
ncbi:MAG: sugar kinase [Candidatus Enteromonas sp.]|nr:sugar kinase [Candidatus Enteromonas sp.]